MFTQKGKAFHRKTDIFKRLMWYVYAGAPKDNAEGGSDDVGGGTWVAIPVNRVKEIIDLNKRKINPPDLSVAELGLPAKRALDFEDVVGQDSLTRMDKPKSNNNNRNKHKKRKRPQGSGGGQPQSQQTPPANLQ